MFRLRSPEHSPASPLPALALALAALLAALATVATLVPHAAAAAPRTAGKACASADVAPTSAGASKARARRATLCLLNVERRAHGVRSLRGEVRLRRAALRHSRNMVLTRFFDHTSPGGSTVSSRIARAGYHGTMIVGENIAWGEGTQATPRAIVGAWMASPGHRSNILDGRFREIGIGLVVGTPRGPDAARATYTTDFGRRR